MLTGKVDNATIVKHRQNIAKADAVAAQAKEAATIWENNPTDPILAENAHGLAEEHRKLEAVSRKSAEFIASNPGSPVITNAAHIFPEGTNTNLGSEEDFTENEKVRRSEAP